MKINNLISKNPSPCLVPHAGPSGKAVRQYFPYVSSESDLQRYKAVTLHKQPSNDTRASSSLSNMPSDSTKTKVRILWRFSSLILCSFLSLSLTHENFSAFTLNRFFFFITTQIRFKHFYPLSRASRVQFKSSHDLILPLYGSIVFRLAWNMF